MSKTGHIRSDSYVFPIGLMQQGLWFLDQVKGGAVYNVSSVIKLKGPLHHTLMEEALNTLVERHEALRTTFSLLEGQPVQVITPSVRLPLPLLDLSGLPQSEQETQLHLLTTQDATQSFDLTQGPLLRTTLVRMGPLDHHLLLTMHHVISDAWSLEVFFRELGALYEAQLQGQPSPLAPLPIQYVDYAVWQREWLQGAVLEEQLSYWKQQLAGASDLLQLPTDHPRPPVNTFRGAIFPFAFPAPLAQALKALSQKEGVTLFMLLFAAFAVLLHRYTNQDDFVIGSPIAGRTRQELEGLIGLFVNTLPLRVDLSGNPTFHELLVRVREVTLDAFEHQDLPFERLVEELQPQRDLSRNPLFQVTFTLQSTRLNSINKLADLTSQLQRIDGGTAKFDLLLDLVETEQELEGLIEYSTDLFEATTIERLADHLHTLLTGIVDGPQQRIAELPLLSERERHQVLFAWNATQQNFPQAQTLPQLFEEQVERTPDAVALVYEQEQLTYAELNERANQLAHYLHTLGVEPEVRVGICLERSIEMVVGLLGVLKAGGAYVPLDPAYPQERLAFMLNDSQASVLVTQLGTTSQLPIADDRIVYLPEISVSQGKRELYKPSSTTINTICLPEQLAYIIYTSGSTGKPKGTAISHRALSNFFSSMSQTPGISSLDSILAVTSFSFDIAALELLLPLTLGARIQIISRPTALSGGDIAKQLSRSSATIMQATPSTWRLLLDTYWNGNAQMKALCGGEALPLGLASQLRSRCTSLWNMYGPTETTIWSSISELKEEMVSVPIGRPIANTQIYLLDPHLQPVPIGVPGELYIGGAGLARGYLNRPELTAERFIPDPFGEDVGARLYRTGDLARYLPDGAIEYLGRLDQQVKVRGYRIELGEIEAVLREQEAVQEAVVLAREDVPGDKRLVAYMVSREQPTPAVAEIRAALRERLPEYMVPSAFVWLDDLPLTPNGKLDRKALPPPAKGSIGKVKLHIEPSTRLDQIIADVWKDALHIEQIDIHENFFDLGGHSLLLARVQYQLSKVLEQDLSLVDLFRFPTIAALSEHLIKQSEEVTHGQLSQSLTGKFAELREHRTLHKSSIAIVGISCHVPGASNVETFWQNLCNGEESITTFPDEELLAAGIDSKQLKDPLLVRRGGVLPDIELFDAAFFGYSPREAELLDPQQRLFLECTLEALQHAGYDPNRYDGAIGVYGGLGMSEYLWRNLYPNQHRLETSGGLQLQIGVDKDFLATRVSYKLNLRGPAFTVQSACSTSLVAVHLACQSLLIGECDMALAGGVSLQLSPHGGYLYQEGGTLSPDGHCRAYDVDAQGTVASSGAGIVVLKRLEDALADGDTVHAVIKGSAINNDGSEKVGYTAPSVQGQEAVIREAQAIAGVSPETIGYIEGHGTATPLGDAIELTALIQAFSTDTPRSGFCALGSVKSNVGHLDAAAGVTGLIKTVLALQHKQIPPSLHFKQSNANIDLAHSPFYVNTRLLDWSEGKTPRRAGVSSFGIGGTNAHVVLEEAPAVEQSTPTNSPQLLVLSAKTSSALETQTAELGAYLEQYPQLELADVAYTLQMGRPAMRYRRMLLAHDLAEATAILKTRESRQLFTVDRGTSDRPIVFLFPGLGDQYVNMGAELYRTERVFQEEIDRCAELLAPQLGLDLRQVLYPSAEKVSSVSMFDQLSFVLPATFIVEYSLVRLWMSWGVRPQAMIGYGPDEYVAACLSGVLSLRDALSLVALRGKLFDKLSRKAELIIPLPSTDVRLQLRGDLSLITSSNPLQSVIQGSVNLIQELRQALMEHGIVSPTIAY